MQAGLNAGLCEFIKNSPTPFHAVKNLGERLLQAGFLRLEEGNSWELSPASSYFVTRNDSSIIAFRTGSGDLISQGFHMLGAHTDSPCLKVKPEAGFVANSFAQVGVEVYGGVLLNPWFDDKATTAHSAFGLGIHYCLGWRLAEIQLSSVLTEVLTRIPDIRAVGKPDVLRSNFIAGIKRLSVSFTPEASE